MMYAMRTDELAVHYLAALRVAAIFLWGRT